MKLPTNLYIRIAGREYLRVNLYALLVVLLTALLAFCALGCSYRVMPEQAAQQVEAVVPVVKTQSAKTQERAATYKAKADAEPQAELKLPWMAAYNEALQSCSLNAFVAAQIEEGMGQSQPVPEFAQTAIAPLALAATAATGIPWLEILGIATAAIGTLGAVKAKRHFNDIPKEIWEWEEAVEMHPNMGPAGGINYDDPATKSSAKMNLSADAYKRLYPAG